MSLSDPFGSFKKSIPKTYICKSPQDVVHDPPSNKARIHSKKDHKWDPEMIVVMTFIYNDLKAYDMVT